MFRWPRPACLAILVATGVVQVWHILCLPFISGLALVWRTGLPSAHSNSCPIRMTCRTPSPPNSIEFNVAVMVGPGARGAGLSQARRKVVLRVECTFFPCSDHSTFPHHRPFSAGEDFRVHVSQRSRESDPPQAELDGSRNPAGFLYDCVAMPMRTNIPVFVKYIYRRGPDNYGNLLALMGLGSVFGSRSLPVRVTSSAKDRLRCWR